MKKLKKVIIVFLNLILINLLVVLAISLNLKTVIKDGIIKETIKQSVFTKEYKEMAPKVTTENEQINEILESKEIQDLIDKYLDITIDSLLEEEEIDEVELEKDMLEYLRKNKSVLENKLGMEITDEMINQVESQYESKELSRMFKQSIDNTKRNMPEESKIVLKGYNYLISKSFKIAILALILLDLIIIALLEKSIYSLLGSMGYSSIISGIGLLIMTFIVKMVVVSLSSLNDFKLVSLSTTGIVYIVIGIVLVILKRIINKKNSDKEEDEHEVSEISTEKF